MNAKSIIEDWKRRLVRMAENPPYVFRDTPQNLSRPRGRRHSTLLWPLGAVERMHAAYCPSVRRQCLLARLRLGDRRADVFPKDAVQVVRLELARELSRQLFCLAGDLSISRKVLYEPDLAVIKAAGLLPSEPPTEAESPGMRVSPIDSHATRDAGRGIGRPRRRP